MSKTFMQSEEVAALRSKMIKEIRKEPPQIDSTPSVFMWFGRRFSEVEFEILAKIDMASEGRAGDWMDEVFIESGMFKKEGDSLVPVPRC